MTARTTRSYVPAVRLARRAVVARRHKRLGPADVFLAHYPKSGGTWIKLMTAELVLGRPVGFETAEETIPFVGRQQEGSGPLPGGGRLIKTHESFRGEYRRAIFLVRDVRDVLVSYFHYWRIRQDVDMTLDQFVDRFVRGTLDGYGTWTAHTSSWLAAGDSGVDVLVLRYEDVRSQPRKALGEIAAFLEVEADESRLAGIVEHNSIAAMKTKEREERTFFQGVAGREAGTGFVRKGSVGGWRDELSERHLSRLAPAEDLLVRLDYPSLKEPSIG